MRKFLATIALFIVMIGTLAPVSFSLPENSPQKVASLSFNLMVHTAEANTCPVGQTTIPDKDANGNIVGSHCGTPPDDDSSGFDCPYADVGCWIVSGLVEYILLPIPSFVASLFGITSDLFLKFAINPAVYGRCAATGCDDVANAIRIGWGIVRDFANIGFIFALFVAAFMLILDKTSVGGKQFEPKKVVVRVIMMALLVNFSLFFCRMIIQTADIFSNLLYSRIDATTSGGNNGVLSNALSSVGVKSVSLALVAKVNPQEILTSEDMKNTGSLATYVIISVISFFLYFVFIFMFGQMIFIFAGRIFALWIGMIMAPFAFVSYSIPFLEDNPYIGFENWLKNFVKLAFMIPIYLFFLYLTLIVLDIHVGQTTLDSIKALETQGNWVTKVVYMVISKLTPLFGAIFMLMYGKKWAVEMSGVVGEMAGKISGAVTGAAVGAVSGGAAFVGRQSAGRLGSFVAEKTADKPMLSGLNTLGKGLSTSTFDVRNSKAFSTGMSYTSKATGQKMDIGSNNLQEKGGYAATGGPGQILQDRRDRIADKKATEKEQEALERANNPQSIENVRKRNTERALKQTQAAKAAEEAKIAAEAENQVVDIEKTRTTLIEEETKINTTIEENNKKIKDLEDKLAGKDIPSDADVANAAKDKKDAETEKTQLDAEEVALVAKIAANAAKKVPDGMGVTQAAKDQAQTAIAQEKADLDAEKLRLDAKKDANKKKMDNATAVEEIKEAAGEKAKLEASNTKKEEEKAVNNAKLAALDNIKGKTAAQVKDEAEIKKAEAEGSKEKADLDKATKDADEEAKKIAELQEKIKKAEKEKDAKLAEELKKELNGDKWQEIEDLEDRIKKANTKEMKDGLKKELEKIEIGGKQKKLNEARGKAIVAKADYENKHGKAIKALEDLAKDTEKTYKEREENKARVAVFTERENKLKIDLVRDTIAVNNMRKKILGAHANAMNNVGAKVDGHPMFSAPINAGKAIVGAVAPILGVITNGRVGAGYVNNNQAYNTAANNVRNNARTGGTTPPPKP